MAKGFIKAQMESSIKEALETIKDKDQVSLLWQIKTFIQETLLTINSKDRVN